MAKPLLASLDNVANLNLARVRFEYTAELVHGALQCKQGGI